MESVNVLFLVPDIHDLQTGGNVFNRRIVEELHPETPVRIVRWSPDETPASRLDLSGTDVVVADSLLARHPDALRAVREEPPAATLVLLVHYLHCIDPRSPDTALATDERATMGVVDGAITTSRFVRQALGGEG